jgi:hypothetical protein
MLETKYHTHTLLEHYYPGNLIAVVVLYAVLRLAVFVAEINLFRYMFLISWFLVSCYTKLIFSCLLLTEGLGLPK